jgi:hypothetical protein
MRAGTSRHRGTRRGGWPWRINQDAHRRTSLVFDAHAGSHGNPLVAGDDVRRVIAMPGARQKDLGALPSPWETVVRQNVRDDVVHAVQVGRLSKIAAASG